jgi:hypothetical protein
MRPSPDRREPVLWLKRLVILSALDSSKEIRNIEFRRGLNIIQTRQMEARGGPVAGHSVGKTLLMRLIRYMLGEPHFGTEETATNIAAVLETAFVVGHWCIAGADWIVVRPMGKQESADSHAGLSDNWRQFVDAPQTDHAYRGFLNAVSEAVLGSLPTFTLPRGRDAKLLDVLAWLSRDYQCGYRRANEWRHDDANSGPSLDREENSQIMQWLLGLMSSDEVDLRLKHRKLLDKQAQHKRDADREESRLETLRPALWEKLELAEDVEVVDDQKTFDSVKPVEVVADRIRSLEKLKQERLAESRIGEFEAERTAVQEKVNDAEATIRSCSNTIQFILKQIKEYEADPTKPYARCQADPCWMKEQATKTAFDPARDDHLADLRGQQEEQVQNLEGGKSAKEESLKELKKITDRSNRERVRLAAEVSGIDETIGRWKGFQRDAEAYQKVVTSVAKSTKSQKRAGREVDASLKTQETVRSKHLNEVKSLTDIYQQTLQRIFGEEAIGEIQIDANGLQPVPDKKLAPSGAAMSVMTTVLAFDISCVAASIAGVGRHPRFVMHDSPREGEMQPPLFRRLFEVVVDLEARFTNADEMSFQYIITTATELPSDLTDDNLDYVRETLDALSDDGLLLKRRF